MVPRPYLRGAVAVLATATLTACDIPTEAPRWDTTWIVPAERVELAVDELLPAGVTVAGNAFLVAVPGTSISVSLAEMCPPCVALHGLMAPKPEFTYTFSGTVTLPADVVEATLASAVLEVTLSHDFGFDPLRPPGSTTNGRLAVEARSGDRSLGFHQISSLAPGTVLTVPLTLAPGAITRDIQYSITIESPAGGPVAINANSRLTVVATPRDVRIASGRVRLANRTLTSEAVDLDVADIDDEAIINRVRSGALHLAIENPFQLTGQFTLRITGDGVDLTKAVTIPQGQSTARVEFSGAELRSILGRNVQLTLTGSASGTGPDQTVLIMPGQAIAVTPRIELVVGIRE
jgi:hypothetical protein